jgi:hypothetical protein
MNFKLLKELSKQAETECGWSEVKFAELIIRECADIATMNQYQPFTAGTYVLKHFGLEVCDE